MSLDDRKKRILKAIIDDYINTAEPISSRTIARRHELGLSSATIRNEMADLEDLGFLAQPHTSSGRLPSDSGYRFYVDQLMDMDELTKEEIESVRHALGLKMSEIEHLIKAAASVLSRSTKYTSIATAPQVNTVNVRVFQLVWVEDRKLLVVMVISGNIVKNSLIKMNSVVAREMVEIYSGIISDFITGLPIQKVKDALMLFDLEKNPIEKEIFDSIVDGILDCIGQVDVLDYFLDGTKNILNFPEFKNLEKARLFLDMMEQKDVLCKIFGSNDYGCDINIHIGHENEIIEAKDCSVIITNYSLGDTVLGSIGIIGPTRMEYGRVITYMNHIRNKINHEIKRLIEE